MTSSSLASALAAGALEVLRRSRSAQSHACAHSRVRVLPGQDRPLLLETTAPGLRSDHQRCPLRRHAVNHNVRLQRATMKCTRIRLLTRASFACVLIPRRRRVHWTVHLNNEPRTLCATRRQLGCLHLCTKPAMLGRPRVVRLLCVENNNTYTATLECVVQRCVGSRLALAWSK